MVYLIDKDTLVAEIEKRQRMLDLDNPFGSGGLVELQVLKDKLDTLEVKEVDLEKYYHDFLQKEWFGNSHVRTVSEMMAFTAKHFFELGIMQSVNESIIRKIVDLNDEAAKHYDAIIKKENEENGFSQH